VLQAGWAFVWIFLGGWALATLRFMFPNVLYEPPAAFKAGYPDEYEVGLISTKWKKSQRVWIVRTQSGFYAVWARCTHLGCTPNWFVSENRFKCPCHGSNFSRFGDVIAGPAPRPLYRVAVSLASDGQLFIDKAIKENRPGLRDKAPFFLNV